MLHPPEVFLNLMTTFLASRFHQYRVALVLIRRQLEVVLLTERPDERNIMSELLPVLANGAP